jgi:hypothetical protein
VDVGAVVAPEFDLHFLPLVAAVLCGGFEL